MNKQEIQNKINELEKQLTEFKEELNKLESKVWKPKYGDKYYYVSSIGEVKRSTWTDDSVDAARYTIGNRFKTEEEAEFEAKKLKAVAELERFAEEHNEPIIWNNRETVVYYISYDYLDKKLSIYFTLDIKSNDIYFSSKELARQAIEEIGEERIKKYYLGVENNE